MAFTIINSTGSFDTFGPPDSYTFDGQGLLVITRANGVRRIYGPSGWVYLEEQPEG